MGRIFSVRVAQLTRAGGSLCDECRVPWNADGALEYDIEEMWSSLKDDQSEFCQETEDRCPTTAPQQEKTGKFPMSPISELWSYIDDMDDIIKLSYGWHPSADGS